MDGTWNDERATRKWNGAPKTETYLCIHPSTARLTFPLDTDRDTVPIASASVGPIRPRRSESARGVRSCFNDERLEDGKHPIEREWFWTEELLSVLQVVVFEP